MLQRIQSIYLALAVILLVLCCSMPLAAFHPQGMGLPSTLYSIAFINGDGVATSYLPCSILVVTVLCELLLVLTIMGYKNRKSQMKKCLASAFCLLLWYAVYALNVVALAADKHFTPSLVATFPAIAFFLVFMARHAIKKDDELVRSADRIR